MRIVSAKGFLRNRHFQASQPRQRGQETLKTLQFVAGTCEVRADSKRYVLHMRRLEPTDALVEMVDLQLGVGERVNPVVD